jgi:3-deoxy-D-manno-octulosonate 8-phosphate phosphatase (KDO 8-P phosphatase)
MERARQLKIEHVYLGSWNKVEALEDVLVKLGLPREEVAFVGDSYIDMPAMELVGVPISVPNGHPLVKDLAVHVTECNGGEGVLLEVVEWLLTHQGRWTDTLAKLRKKLLEPHSAAAG